MMARSTNAPFKGRIQKRKTNHLQIITFGLQRTAGPYKGANERHWCHVADCRPQNPTPIVLRPPVEVDIDDATIGFMR